MKNNDIAVIGLSVKMPGCNNYEEFQHHTINGSKISKGLSGIRLQDTNKILGSECNIAPFPYLERIDLFDAEYFSISPGEATRMSPEKKLILQQVVLCLLNAGLSVEEVKGSNTGIFLSQSQSQFEFLVDNDSNNSITETNSSLDVTRVAHFLDLRGPAITIDTTCSSSLTSLHLACQNLRDGTCDMALVGGVSIGAVTQEWVRSSAVSSKNFECRAFDKDANGTIGGEGLVFIVTKDFNKALEDNNHIFGHIKGSAINHGGGRLPNITSPSAEAQSDVIKKAWINAEINPEKVAMIESHGTGTVLGDPIELQGISQAFNFKNGNTECAIGAVKSQFGHLDGASGILGFVKLMLAAYYNIIPPIVNFKELHNYGKKLHSGLYFPLKKMSWPKDKPYGGVSSFGLSGTNVHVIIQKPKVCTSMEVNDFYYILYVKARTPNVVKKISQYLKDKIKDNSMNINVQLICKTTNRVLCGNYFYKFHGYTIKNLLKNIEHVLQQEVPTKEGHIKNNKLYCFIDDDCDIDHKTFQSMTAVFGKLAYIHQELCNQVPSEISDSMIEKLIRLLSYYSWLESMGLKFEQYVVTGVGVIISNFMNNKISIKQAIQRIQSNDNQAKFDRNNFSSYVLKLAQSQNVNILYVGNAGVMKDILQEIADDNILLIGDDKTNLTLQMINFIERTVGRVNSVNIYGNDEPTYPLIFDIFDTTRYWPNIQEIDTSSKTVSIDNNSDTSYGLSDIKNIVKSIWIDCLMAEEINFNMDFFDSGGSSLLALDVQDEINKIFSIQFMYEDMFSYTTINTISVEIYRRLNGNMSKSLRDVECMHENNLSDVKKRKDRYCQLIYETKDYQIEIKYPEKILLTGVTGYLGIHLLAQLLKTTDAVIYCLIRKIAGQSSEQRLRNHMEWHFPKLSYSQDRIKIVETDNFVNTIPDIDGIDIVYHSAGSVTHYSRYSDLEEANINLTQRLIDWSQRNNVSLFNHMSTIAVSGLRVNNFENIEYYETDLDIGQLFHADVYMRTKFEAEQLLLQSNKNMDVRCYRIGNISGDSQSGVFQKNQQKNASYLDIKKLSTINYYTKSILNIPTFMNPVDFIANSIVRISLLKNVPYPVFHITDPYTIRVSDLIKAFNELGFNITEITDSEFSSNPEKYMNNNSCENIFDKISKNISKCETTNFEYKTDYTTMILQKLGFSWEYDRIVFLKRCIRYQINIGFIKDANYM